MSPAPRKPAAPKPKPKPKPEAAAKPAPPRPRRAAVETGAGSAGAPTKAGPPPPPDPGRGPAEPGRRAAAPLPAVPGGALRPRPAPELAPLPPSALGVAGLLGAAAGEPVPRSQHIERAAPLETGLSDYVYWLQLLADEPPKPAPPGSRRGRIWA